MFWAHDLLCTKLCYFVYAVARTKAHEPVPLNGGLGCRSGGA